MSHVPYDDVFVNLVGKVAIVTVWLTFQPQPKELALRLLKFVNTDGKVVFVDTDLAGRKSVKQKVQL